MTFALFDLDDTIIAGDCSALWNPHMVALGWAEDADFLRCCEEMNRAYHAGTLSMERYMAVTLAPLAGRRVEDVREEVGRFVDETVAPLVRADALRAIGEHRALGDRLGVISASGSHLVEPIAASVGIFNVLAIDAEVRDGTYTGRTSGIITFKEGKVTRLAQWLEETGETLDGASFYSDSRNDLPLLLRVGRPHAVNPDGALDAHARHAGWPVLHWA